jgi:hypothetical protein
MTKVNIVSPVCNTTDNREAENFPYYPPKLSPTSQAA